MTRGENSVSPQTPCAKCQGEGVIPIDANQLLFCRSCPAGPAAYKRMMERHRQGSHEPPPKQLRLGGIRCEHEYDNVHIWHPGYKEYVVVQRADLRDVGQFLVAWAKMPGYGRDR